ncbi:ABC transporter ATP-binding protein [Pseudorhodobacter sp. W20_MBD10_FR17]|uniref:ABC transporter ATP-binding protein n=1 Tax=Pseudorhodobacter sp. W20_MBD10_FR17 TaxID=3240266 RepID=UPI003F9C2664
MDTGQKVDALRDVSFEVNQGEFFVLLGPSGSGKTTTLRAVAGIETADSGVIRIGATSVFDSAKGINMPAEERPVGMVFQSYALWPHMNVLENITFPLRKGVRRVAAPEIKRRVDAVAETLQLTPYLSRPIAQLSGGQQQRVALARALALEPQVLLMDEPLSNLDAKLRAQLRVEIKNLTQSLGITTLYVTHDQVEAMVMGDQIAVMNNGAIAEQGVPDQLYKRPASEFVAKFLGEMNFVRGNLRRSGSRFAVDTPMGTIEVDTPPATITGDAVKLGFRLEDVHLGPQPGAVVFPATVTHRYYIGDAILCDFVVSGGTFSARLPNTAAVIPGETVDVSILSSSFTLFPDNA